MTPERTVSIRPRTALQKTASHPQKHAWVSASAGTGKTTVLTDRMLRLMVTGSPPDRILAITFTRAAAAEMLIRLTKTLGGWRSLDDFELGYQLKELEIEPTPQRFRRARSLFARALEVPGGLNVQTIHAFAQQLLGAFPVEAGLPPGFVALSDRDSATLQARALSEIIAEAQAGQNTQLLDDIGEIVVASGDRKLTRALSAMLPHAAALESLKAPAAAAPKLRARLNLPDSSLDEALAAALSPPDFPENALKRFIALAPAGGKTGEKAAAALADWSLLDPQARALAAAAFTSALLTREGTPIKALVTKKSDPAMPDLVASLAGVAEAVRGLQSRYAIADTAGRHLRVGLAYAQRYAQLKRASLAIDYDDMIRRTADLLGQEAGPSWIGYKLDTRFDHILVDEAQDTNEAQWRIIRHLAEDFWAPDPEGRRERTLFVVGDYKQAIYGFQGTDPEYFADAHRTAAAAAEDGGRPLEDVSLDKSFRSGPAVLALVDAFLATQAEGEGRSALGLDGDVPAHVPDRVDAASQAVLLPVLVPEENPDSGEAEREAAERLIAGRLAAQIAAWLKPGDPQRLWMPGATERGGRLSPRYARPSDIMILLRKRSRLMTLLVAALHREGVPVAGVDRLLLREPYAVIDLLALVRFAVQPQDDLNLAELLVSPFIGWDHEEVRALSQERPADLWSALCDASGPRVEAARQWLLDALHLAERTTPYEFLDRALSGPLKARAKLLARLGVEAVEAIDELLNQALAFEADHPPMHEAFLAWIETGNVEVKRENDRESQAVRLLTIHGAKGLEAPVVVLADAAHDPRPDDSGHVLATLPGLPAEFPIFYPGQTPLPTDLAQLRDAKRVKDAQEDMRLLYVALTRAADHLFVAGAVPASKAGSLGPEDTRWHAKIARAFDRLAAGGHPVEDIEMPLFPGAARRIRLGRWTEPDGAITVEPDKARQEHGTLDLSPAPPATRGRRTVAPSRLGDDHLAALAPLKERRDARRRGSWLHALFERLPDAAPDQRRARALAWLTAEGARDADADRLADTALAVINAPENAALFGPDSLAEAPVAGIVNGVGVTGVVDRLLVTPDRVRIVDFKTGVAVPETAESAPAGHLKQMAAYAAVLARAFPDRPVEAALLYTAAPRLITLPPTLLARHEPAA